MLHLPSHLLQHPPTLTHPVCSLALLPHLHKHARPAAALPVHLLPSHRVFLSRISFCCCVILNTFTSALSDSTVPPLDLRSSSLQSPFRRTCFALDLTRPGGEHLSLVQSRGSKVNKWTFFFGGGGLKNQLKLSTFVFLNLTIITKVKLNCSFSTCFLSDFFPLQHKRWLPAPNSGDVALKKCEGAAVDLRQTDLESARGWGLWMAGLCMVSLPLSEGHAALLG